MWEGLKGKRRREGERAENGISFSLLLPQVMPSWRRGGGKLPLQNERRGRGETREASRALRLWAAAAAAAAAGRGLSADLSPLLWRSRAGARRSASPRRGRRRQEAAFDSMGVKCLGGNAPHARAGAIAKHSEASKARRRQHQYNRGCPGTRADEAPL